MEMPMTILEMERRSGLERTNIRFYEREGLLTPERRDNGYRDYSEDDLQLLLKIKLLRRLGFSLDAIRSLKDGGAAMEETLAHRLAAMGDERRALDATEEVCTEMRRDGVTFDTLDAPRYLAAYDRALLPSAAVQPVIPAAVPDTDRVDPVRCPWRRYFARMLDLELARLPIWAVMMLIFRVNAVKMPDAADWAVWLMAWLLVMAIEPLLLSRWGTTPGKWLMGLRLENIDGSLLTYGDALVRTARVFSRGAGWTVPIYSLWRYWKSYKAVTDGSDAEWDEDINYIAYDFRWQIPVRYIAVRAAAFALTALLAIVPALPIHRGAELTVTDFVENYNALAKFHGTYNYELLSNGTFRTAGDTYAYESASDLIYPLMDQDLPSLTLQIDENAGYITDISYTRELPENKYFMWADSDGLLAIQLAFKARAWAEADLKDAYASEEALKSFLTEIQHLRNFGSDNPLPGGSAEAVILGYRLTYSVIPNGELTYREQYRYSSYESYTVTFRMEPL